MRILVTGPRGMLGQAVRAELEKQGATFWLLPGRVGDAGVVKGFRGVDAIINCAGVIPQSPKANPLAMIRGNAEAPHHLAAVCDGVEARLIHVSTDCVFGHQIIEGPYSEGDEVAPDTLYAQTKAAGEVTYGAHLTIRTSFVSVGPYGLLHEVMTGSRIVASDRLLWTGHTVGKVAELLVELARREDVTGLLHVPGEAMSRLALVRLLAQRFRPEGGLEIVRDDSFERDRRLASGRWAPLGLPALPTFAEELQRWTA